ncbi:fatty acid--CoA ligase family protein [Peribacillus deserti]|uniref:Long-chain fatty acid--CoA ligase n=1 Tax=Peribacillus deserti TaxID=673318 RepID=A0A2N5M026_9BACI|nr:fatty acid--CoA ligase family protein [Peribacillus deserti]PLT27719.1 long-chain fatty acid--CoA ligase [Peribacillus deserti]
MNLSQRLHETALVSADKTAYIFMDQKASYRELDMAVSKFSNGLKKLGIKKGDHIALIVGNTPHFIIGLYGALRAGATVIPINPIYTPDEIGFIINNGDVKLVVTLDVLLPLMEGIDRLIPQVENIIVCPTSNSGIEGEHQSLHIYPKLKTITFVIESGEAVYEETVIEDDDTAVILYTSGTTGKPKGAMLTHKNLYSNASDVGSYLKMNESDYVITALPMFHVFCLTVVLNAPLLTGAALLIMPKFSPKEVFHLAKKYSATVFAGVPTMYNFLYQYPDGTAEDLKSLRLCISGGASLPVSLLKAFEQKFGVLVSEGYGLSEASPVTCFNPLDRPRKPGSIGMNILNVQNRVVNELGEEVPAGQVGELIVKGPNVMKGYYKLPEETAAALKDGWLYTGDLARMDEDGYFYIVDRKKDMIIVGGYNVYPREVEEVLFAHPNIIEAAVIGVPDPNLGEAIHAFVVSNLDTLTAEDLTRYCQEHLAKYKVPSVFDFLEELPKNTTGKILRRSLKNHISQTI